MATKPKEKPHYVNNREFSLAVLEYCESAQAAKKQGGSSPIVTDYYCYVLPQDCRRVVTQI